MKVYLMTDMEGIAGIINSKDWIYPESRYYELGKEFVTKEVNAAVCGFFAAGADEVVVHDGHGYGAININLLDKRAKYQRGWQGPYPFGLERGYDVMAWVGQHPKAGTQYGHICHTGSFNVIDYQINNISVGEFGQCMFCGQMYGVKPIFASGDLAFTKEAAALACGIEAVAVKEGVIGGSGDECTTDQYEVRNWGAIHLQPEAARELIRDGAEKALLRFREAPESFNPTKISAPYSIKAIYRENRGKYYNVAESSNDHDFIALMNAGL